MIQKLDRYQNGVKIWLAIGIIMIFFQVFIGGITRLTGSGLSITKWEILTGTIPPMNNAQWEEAFNLYKSTPQYKKINEGMNLKEFKFIYFWEYIHRLWARLMGFVFLIPLVYFLWKKQIDRFLLKRLAIVFFLAALVASFGWIMVASGLINRPWVNAYKLTMHLSLALVLYSYLLWTVFLVMLPARAKFNFVKWKRLGVFFTILISIQIILGGVMSGMKAGLYFPTWPSMNGEWVPSVLLQPEMWTYQNFVEYDKNLFMPAIIQVLHRNLAYLLVLGIGAFSFIGYRSFIGIEGMSLFRKTLIFLTVALLGQVLLGILTLINCIGSVPVDLGVAHQSGAIILLSIMLFTVYLMGPVQSD